MRFSPDGQFVSFTAGYGGGPLSVAIVEAATGRVVTRLPGGHDPCWIGPQALLARSQDGAGSYMEQDGFACGYVGANDGDLDAAAGRAAFTPDRGVGVTAYVNGKPERTFPSTFEPKLSAGGSLVVRDLASGALRFERLAGCTDASGPAPGPGTRPRWSSQTLVWDTLPYGRVLGRSSPDQPTVDLSVPGHACTFPVALWTGAVLVVGMVLDDGDLTLCEWGSLLARAGTGWPVVRSGGSAFDWDLAILGGDPHLVRVAYMTPSGDLGLVSVDLTAPQKNLTSDVKPPEPEPGPGPGPEPGPEPLPPEPGPLPPEPLPPEPEMPQPTVDQIPRDQTVMAAEAIETYLIGNPRLGLPAGIWPTPWDGTSMAQRIDVVSAYLIGEWCPEVCRLGPLPSDGPGWDTRRNLALDHTFHVIEAERGEKPAPPEPGVAGPIRGPLAVEGRHFAVP